MSNQQSLLGIESYHQIRRPTKNKGSFSLALFQEPEITEGLKKGEKILVQKTGYIVEFVKMVGQTSYWLSEGATYQASPRLLKKTNCKKVEV